MTYTLILKKPGFLPNMWVPSKDFRKKTRFLTSPVSWTKLIEQTLPTKANPTAI